MATRNIPQTVLDAFCKHFLGTKPEYFAGGHEWSDGTLYLIDRVGEKHVLKLLQASSGHSLETVLERMAFARYLAEHGIQNIKPVFSERNLLVESSSSGEGDFLAVCWKFIPGKAIGLAAPGELQAYYRSWGALLGKMHRLAKQYPNWQASLAKDPVGNPMICREAEWKVFYNWLQDAEVKEAWLNLKQELDILPVNRENHGFVHNDAHTGNILQNEQGLVLLDFDVANYLWFALDLAICLNSEYARIMHHSGHQALAGKLKKLFLVPFMQGYGSENTLPEPELKRIGKFIHYRQFLMFAVFYNQIKENAPRHLDKMKRELISGYNYTRSQVEEFFL
jgi:Ser/Thr protein kinase RdoA (MazF antagonist)